MKILKKLLVRIILLILTVGIVCGSVVAVLGYFMYRDALKEQSLEDQIAGMRADPSYTTLAELPDIYLEAGGGGEGARLAGGLWGRAV